MTNDAGSVNTGSNEPCAGTRKYSIGDYVLVNLVVWGILAVFGLIVYFGIDSAPVVPYLLGVVGGGFTIVSIYDYLFDRLARRSDEDSG